MSLNDQNNTKKTRLNTSTESQGAEFLVLGNLLIEGITSYKTYHNFPGYDLVAVNPSNNTSARIQVKSRYQTSWDGFIINNFDCDFVVLATLNRGNTRSKNKGVGVQAPNFYVFPVAYVKEVRDELNTWGKISKSRMKDYQAFENRWDLIAEFLNNVNATP